MLEVVIKNVQIVHPGKQTPIPGDIGIVQGKIVAVGNDLSTEGARLVYDGKNQLAFPGLVDAHMHTGIYNPLAEDAVTESRAAATGGVTTSLNYMRTGKYYLNKTGPYATFFPGSTRYFPRPVLCRLCLSYRTHSIQPY